MTGFVAYLGKSFLELARTWRGWLLVITGLFFAVSSPVLAFYTPDIVQMATDQGVEISMPDPTYVDAYAQWLKNLGQLGLAIWLISTSGLIASERRSGTAQIVCSKPIRRSTVVMAGALAHITVLAGILLVSTCVTWIVTQALFGDAPLADLAAAMGVWLVLAVLLFGVVAVVSAGSRHSLAAAAAGFGAYLLLSMASIWPAAAEYSPVGLVTLPTTLLAGGDASIAWPLATGCAGIIVLFAGAVGVFKRAEI